PQGNLESSLSARRPPSSPAWLTRHLAVPRLRGNSDPGPLPQGRDPTGPFGRADSEDSQPFTLAYAIKNGVLCAHGSLTSREQHVSDRPTGVEVVVSTPGEVAAAPERPLPNDPSPCASC